MSAQERESKRNFIAILIDSTENNAPLNRSRNPIALSAAPFFDLMAAVLNRGVNAR